jgi:two-component system CheB/CheR fusion protein
MTRVLLVEDSADVLCVLQIELEWMGYIVDASTDATAALALARRARPDVIVSDLAMPGMDGLEFIQRIRELDGLASVPAIALTGASLDHTVRQALASGFTTYMTKPVDIADLDKRIQQLTARWLERRAS